MVIFLKRWELVQKCVEGVCRFWHLPAYSVIEKIVLHDLDLLFEGKQMWMVLLLEICRRRFADRSASSAWQGYRVRARNSHVTCAQRPLDLRATAVSQSASGERRGYRVRAHDVHVTTRNTHMTGAQRRVEGNVEFKSIQEIGTMCGDA